MAFAVELLLFTLSTKTAISTLALTLNNQIVRLLVFLLADPLCSCLPPHTMSLHRLHRRLPSRRDQQHLPASAQADADDADTVRPSGVPRQRGAQHRVVRRLPVLDARLDDVRARRPQPSHVDGVHADARRGHVRHVGHQLGSLLAAPEERRLEERDEGEEAGDVCRRSRRTSGPGDVSPPYRRWRRRRRQQQRELLSTSGRDFLAYNDALWSVLK